MHVTALGIVFATGRIGVGWLWGRQQREQCVVKPGRSHIVMM